MDPMVAVVLVMPLTIVLVAVVLRNVNQARLKGLLVTRYGVRLDPGTHVLKGRPGNWFVLSYPYWEYSKRDGTQDRRHTSNRLVAPVSRVHVDELEIRFRDFMLAYDLVLRLRAGGAAIEASDLERQARDQYRARLTSDQMLIEAHAIYSRFGNDPVGFEHFCGDLFRQQGYAVDVTPSVNDGGLDLRLRREGTLTIVECKCYNPETGSVGRPVLQKLYGANAAERAHRLLVVTTARFTQSAQEYARLYGVGLIDGPGLSAMAGQRAAILPRPAHRIVMPDLMVFVPADARHLYSGSYRRYQLAALTLPPSRTNG